MFRKAFAEFLGRVKQGFRHDSGFGYDRHEIAVALPARHDVIVKVLGDTGARYPAQIETDVESIRLHDGGEDANAAPRHEHEIRQFGLVEVFKIGCFLVRNDHNVPSVVRETIEQYETVSIAMNHKILHVVVTSRDPGE